MKEPKDRRVTVYRWGFCQHFAGVSLPCRTCPAEAEILKAFGVYFLDVHIFLHLRAF